MEQSVGYCPCQMSRASEIAESREVFELILPAAAEDREIIQSTL